MPQKLLYDVSQLDLGRFVYGPDDIRQVNPHRFEFEQLSGIVHVEESERLIVGLREIRDDEFWCRGHIPGRPIFPGVLMLEASAQLCSFYCGRFISNQGFFGFAAIDGVRFRGVVTPGHRLILIARGKTVTPSRSQFDAQGVVDGRLVFEASILGLRL